MISIKNISKSYKNQIGIKSVQALKDVSFNVEKGEVFGFLGPNGAGKSTLIKILINLIYPDSGSVKILDLDVDDMNMKKRLGYLPENPYFYDHLTALELLWFSGKTYGFSNNEIKEKSEKILAKVELTHAMKRPIRTYSKGMVQRAGLAMALLHEPDIVILDEPMSGLDPMGRKLVSDLILELKSSGKTVFFSTHILNDIEKLCDSVAIIINGKIRLISKTGDIVSESKTLEDCFIDEVNKVKGEEDLEIV